MIQQEIIAICQSRGIKLTNQRKTIIRAIELLNGTHPDAEAIYQLSSQYDKKIGLATVYRTLHSFVESGILTKLELTDNKARYELACKNGSHHHHIIDIETGEIIEFYDEELELIKTKIAKKLGYNIIAHTLEIYGRKNNE